MKTRESPCTERYARWCVRLVSYSISCVKLQFIHTPLAGAKYLHFDVMDGIFVPSISFGMPVLKSIRPATNLVCDVHLMITEPIRYIEDFVKAGADLITMHLEACDQNA